MAGISMDVKGITPLKRKLNGQFANVLDGTLAAVHKPIRMVMQASLQQVPRDTDALAQSAYEGTPYFDGNFVIMEFGYGGPNVQTNPKTGQGTDDYAWIVHEDMTVNHPIGKSKFLEDPINEHAPHILPRLGMDISRLFR